MPLLLGDQTPLMHYQDAILTIFTTIPRLKGQAHQCSAETQNHQNPEEDKSMRIWEQQPATCMQQEAKEPSIEHKVSAVGGWNHARY
jgi:hypothetical protein